MDVRDLFYARTVISEEMQAELSDDAMNELVEVQSRFDAFIADATPTGRGDIAVKVKLLEAKLADAGGLDVDVHRLAERIAFDLRELARADHREAVAA
jgi:hypothetical protein